MAKVNTKKVVNEALDHAILKFRTFLLEKNPTSEKNFMQTLDRVRREIASQRDDKNPYKGKYPVATATNFRVINSLLNPKEFISVADLAEVGRNDVVLSSLGLKFKDVLPEIFKLELPVIEKLVEDDMSQGIYLGQDCTPVKK